MVKTDPYPPEACDNEQALVVEKPTSQRYCSVFMSSALNQQCPLFLPLWIWHVCVS